MRGIENEKGFSLLEIILALTLSVILALGIGVAVVNMADSYLLAKDATSAMQKGQIAMARMVKELNNINMVNAGATNPTQITFTSYRTGGTVVLSWGGAGTDLLLNGDVLTDSVSGFVLAYYDDYTGSGQATWTATRRVIEITLTLTGAQGVPSAFTSRVAVATTL